MYFLRDWIIKLFSEEHKVPEHKSQVRLYEIVLFFKFVYFVMKSKRVGFNKYVWA